MDSPTTNLYDKIWYYFKYVSHPLTLDWFPPPKLLWINNGCWICLIVAPPHLPVAVSTRLPPPLPPVPPFYLYLHPSTSFFASQTSCCAFRPVYVISAVREGFVSWSFLLFQENVGEPSPFVFSNQCFSFTLLWSFKLFVIVWLRFMDIHFFSIQKSASAFHFMFRNF